MDTVTYPDSKTVEFVNRFMIPFRANTQAYANLAGNYGIQYTPTVLTVDGEGKEHHRTVGFMEPKEFIPSLMFGVAKANFGNSLGKRAMAMLDVLLLEYPRSGIAAEATKLKQEWVNLGVGK
jgi:thioredoxin-related protein